MTDETDATLIVRCRHGDRSAFDTLLTRYARQIFGAAFRILHHREDAIDVTQTAFLRAYEHFDRYDPGQRFDSWLYRIAVNEALDLVRSRRPSESLAEDAVDEQPGPEETAAHDQDDRLMQGALNQLKVEYRVVIVLKHLQGCAYEEIADILECPVKTVKSRLFTARQALRDVLVAKGRL
jgi:RNA polymerase sigma-70 factor (ECF subfamily)